MAGAPKGNQNAVKGNRWAQAIDRALEKRSRAAQVNALDELAEKLLENCDAGDMTALKELGDRLDGKTPQGIQLSGDSQNPIENKVTVEFVRARTDP